MTTRTEDMAYCLMGLFNINMPLLYGEGNRAFLRLQEEIIKGNDDMSIFAWTTPTKSFITLSGLLAPSPSVFSTCESTLWAANDSLPHEITNKGIKLTLKVFPRADGSSNEYIAILEGVENITAFSFELVGICLFRLNNNQYQRVDTHSLAAVTFKDAENAKTSTIFVGTRDHS